MSASELDGGGGATRGGEEDEARATHRMQLRAQEGPRAASARARSARRRREGNCARTSSRPGRSCSPGSTRTCRCRGTACGSLRAVERQRLRLGASESTRERGCTHEGTCCTGCGGKLWSERGGRQRQSIKHLQHEPGAPAPSPHMQLETTHRCRRSCGSAPAARRGRRRTSGRALRDRIGVSSRAPLRRRRSTRRETEREGRTIAPALVEEAALLVEELDVLRAGERGERSCEAGGEREERRRTSMYGLLRQNLSEPISKLDQKWLQCRREASGQPYCVESGRGRGSSETSGRTSCSTRRPAGPCPARRRGIGSRCCRRCARGAAGQTPW